MLEIPPGFTDIFQMVAVIHAVIEQQQGNSKHNSHRTASKLAVPWIISQRQSSNTYSS
jgi:hypothetical protein